MASMTKRAINAISARDARHYAGQSSCADWIRKCIQNGDCHCSDLPAECRKECEKQMLSGINETVKGGEDEHGNP